MIIQFICVLAGALSLSSSGDPAFEAPRTVPAVEGDSSWWQILEGLKVDLVSIDNGGAAQSVGISYEIEHELKKGSRDDAAFGWDSALQFSASGTASLDSSVNPQDFLQTELSYTWAGARFGDDLAWDCGLDLTAGLDANQSFSQRHLTYGLEFSFENDSTTGKGVRYWNIVDYPAAMLRSLSGFSDEFDPWIVPDVFLAVQQITPEGEDPRATVGDSEGYTRGSLELEYRSAILSLSSEQWIVDASWKYYQELGASDVVKAAGLDKYSFFQLDFIKATQEGFFARYVSGQLPFDLGNGSALQIGWTTGF